MRRTVIIIVAILSAVFLISFCSSLQLIWGDRDRTDISRKNIAVIELDGPILESLPVLEQFQKVRENKQLKAVVLRIDSPGGAVGASQEIYLELLKLKEERPVVVSMGNVAASGGLYIGVAGTEIVALPGTITGSMGVLMPLTNISRLLDRWYIDPMPIRSGNLKDAGSPVRPMDEEAQAYLQGFVDEMFEVFRADVVAARELSDEAIAHLSDARVVSGREAVEIGLVDHLGGFRDAVDRARELGEITEEAKLAYLSRRPPGLLERVLSGVMVKAYQAVMKRVSTPYFIQPHFLSVEEN